MLKLKRQYYCLGISNALPLYFSKLMTFHFFCFCFKLFCFNFLIQNWGGKCQTFHVDSYDSTSGKMNARWYYKPQGLFSYFTSVAKADTIVVLTWASDTKSVQYSRGAGNLPRLTSSLKGIWIEGWGRQLEREGDGGDCTRPGHGRNMVPNPSLLTEKPSDYLR